MARVWIALALMAAAAAQRSTYDTSLDDADAYIGALGLPKGLPRLEVKYKKGGFGAKYYVSGSDSRISTRSNVALNERPLVEWEPTKFGAHQDRYAVMLLAPDEPKRAVGDGSADGEKGPILHWFALNCAQSTSKNDEKCYHLIPYSGPRSTDGILNDNSSLAKPVHGACVVVEIRPRDASAPPSFRFPDRDVRSLFDMQRDIYPSSLFNTTHFCGLPRAVTWAFTLCKPFMRREAYNAMVLKPGFAHLPSVMPKESILTRWGGQLTFDIDAWVEYRAEKEGIPLDQLCPRSKGRRFDPKAVLATSADAMDDGAAATITAKALLAGEVSGKMPRVHGIVEKRGSGRGLFGTVRWKSKLLVVCAEIGCVYFDSDEISDKNKAARLMPLGDDGTKVEHRADRSGGANCFALVTPAREFLFSVPSADKATEWVAAIQAEIEAAQRTREEMRRNVEETARVHS